MEYQNPDPTKWTTKFVVRVGSSLRSDKKFSQQAVAKNEQKRTVLRKKKLDKLGYDPKTNDPLRRQSDVNELGERNYGPLTQASTFTSNKDHTEMLHGLAHHDSFDSLVDQVANAENLKDPYFDSHNPVVEKRDRILAERNIKQLDALPEQVWKRIALYLDVDDAASLSISTKMLYNKLGSEYLQTLELPENQYRKMAFLNHLEQDLPRHLLCFPCNKYHRRSNFGQESLKANYISNPLFDCPNVRDAVLPRMRITHGRELPYSFVQLVMRGHKHTAAHGIKHESLARSWKCKDSKWSHRTRYMVVDGRLLVRITSQCIAPPASDQTETSQRHLLYDREEYRPFFSICSHWQDGELMATCKCALSHIPGAPKSYYQQLKKAPKVDRQLAKPNFMVLGCDNCRPARRCPECPSEYLIETPMIEDHMDPNARFKHALRVTRWADLGNGSNPYTSPEWAAIQGTDASTLGETYDSFTHVGRRSVAGIFESRISGTIPGARMISMNPKNQKYGEDGHGWY